MTTLASGWRFPRRRPVRMLLLALAILIGAIGVRTWQAMEMQATPKPPPAPVALSSQEVIQKMEERLRRNPDDTFAYAQLGLGLLQQVRERGDVTYYNRAGQAFTAALARDPQQVDALVGQGVLALALHDFRGALDWADKAWAINPYRAEILGIRVDGQVELGRYPEAVATLQQMVDLRPDLSSYSRIAYLRELHGDVIGASEAMRSAVKSAVPGTESWLWTLTQLGNLYFNRGDLASAEEIYQQALELRPDYPYALAGLARVRAAQGEVADAIDRYQAITARLPLPAFVIELGELYAMTGDEAAAQQQFDLVRTIQQLNAAAGMNVDMEMALFNANHGHDPAATVAQARAAYADRPTLYAADTLAWALYQQGSYIEAQQYSNEARRLNTQDALLYFHAGMIEKALGNLDAGQRYLAQALRINPYFSLQYAAQARALTGGE
ncbi:MAG: tetratricopeptide repeat protein [Caldilineaceae bacterium]